MSDSDISTVRRLIAALHAVEDELRDARRTADFDALTALVRRKRTLLRQIRRRRLLRDRVA
jgi:hypothetical protein